MLFRSLAHSETLENNTQVFDTHGSPTPRVPQKCSNVLENATIETDIEQSMFDEDQLVPTEPNMSDDKLTETTDSRIWHAETAEASPTLSNTKKKISISLSEGQEEEPAMHPYDPSSTYQVPPGSPNELHGRISLLERIFLDVMPQSSSTLRIRRGCSRSDNGGDPFIEFRTTYDLFSKGESHELDLSSPTLNPSEFECRYPFSYWQTELRNFQTTNAETSPSDESLALALSEVNNGTQEQALDLSLSSKLKVLASCGSLYGSRPQIDFLFENNLANTSEPQRETGTKYQTRKMNQSKCKPRVQWQR